MKKDNKKNIIEEQNIVAEEPSSDAAAVQTEVVATPEENVVEAAEQPVAATQQDAQPIEPEQQTDDKPADETDADAAQPAEQQIDSDEEVGNPRKNKKSNLWGNIFCAVSIVATFVAMYFASNYTAGEETLPFWKVMLGMNVKYVLISVGVMFAMMLLDSLKYVVIMWANKIRPHYPTALKVALLGKYYDDITPFSSGGQPMQIYYLNKKGLNGGQSTGVIMVKMAFNMTMWLIICFCLMVFNRSAFLTYVSNETQRQTLTAFAWVGFGVNCFLPLAILLFVVFPRITQAITRWVLNIGYKLKIVKDKEAVFNRAKKGVTEFVSSFVAMVKKPVQSFLLLILCIAEPFLGMTLPYFVVMAVGGNAIAPLAGPELMFAIMTLNVYVSMAATIIPTPGNMGALETAFMLTLSTIVEGTLFWTVLGWRLLSFYSYIFIGLGMTIFQMVRKNARKKTLG